MLFGIGKHSWCGFPNVLIIIIVVIPWDVSLFFIRRLFSTLRNPKVQLGSLFGLDQPQLAVINVGSPDRFVVILSAHHFLEVKVLCCFRLDFLYRLVQLHCVKKVTSLVQSQSVPSFGWTLYGPASSTTHSGHINHACRLMGHWSIVAVLALHIKEWFLIFNQLIIDNLCELNVFCGLCVVVFCFLFFLLFLFWQWLIQSYSRFLLSDFFLGFFEFFHLPIFLLVDFNHIPNHLRLILH